VNPFLTTHPSGRRLDLVDPQPKQIEIVDIAWALSRLCRFVGHVPTHYSVAEHCCRVAMLVAADPTTDPRLILAALLHDAAEAYLGDWSSPLKQVFRAEAPGALAVERRIETAIGAKFNVTLTPKDPRITLADAVMLATERRDLKGPAPMSWQGDWPEPHPIQIVPWDADRAFRQYMRLFDLLTA
jgi:hypothetical protein